jgi:hypothetical protein
MNWLSENYKWLFDGVAGAVAIAVVSYVLHRFLGSQDRQQGVAALTAQGAKVTNSPVASGSTQIVNSPTFNMSPAPTSATPAPQEEKEQPPCVSFVQPRSILLYEDDFGVLHEAPANFERGYRGLIAHFKNRPAKTAGAQSPAARSVTASLIFRSPDATEELHISHGTWLGRYEHSASFYAGDSQHLVVAINANPAVTFENPNSTNPFGGYWRSGRMIRHPKQMALPGKNGEVEITLVDRWNVTVFTGQFDYRMTADEMYVKQRV